MANAEDLAGTWTRARQPVPEFAAATVFQSQLETLNCLKPAGERIADRTLCFQRQEDLWRAVLSEEITENGFLELDGFYLTEWVPLRPGLYHTPDARWAREEALRNGRVEDTPKAPRSLLTTIRQAIGYRGDTPDDVVVLFDPWGKMSMIDGGVGCIRLKPLPRKEEFRWRMGASSSLVPHEGFPVMLTDADYQRVYDDLRKRGKLRCKLTGYLRFIEDNQDYARGYVAGVPQLYLEAKTVEPTPSQESGFPRVSAVISFASHHPEWRGLQASFVTFEAGRPGSLEEAAEWLEKVYVGDAYQGRVWTDFDQQMKRFQGATFSLERLFNALVKETEADTALRDAGVSSWHREQLLKLLREGNGNINVYFAENVGVQGERASAGSVGVSSTGETG